MLLSARAAGYVLISTSVFEGSRPLRAFTYETLPNIIKSVHSYRSQGIHPIRYVFSVPAHLPSTLILSSFDEALSHVSRIGEMRNAYNILVRKPERKRPQGRPRHRGEDKIRLDLKDIEWEDVD
jgi:hypothetical protein